VLCGRGRLIGQLPDGRNYYWTGTFDHRGPRYVDDHGMMVDPGREAAAAQLNRAFTTFFVGWMILSASVAAIAAIGIAAPEMVGAGAAAGAGEAATAAAARQGLIAALRAAGVRFTESAIQGITRTVVGRIVWLEAGGATAGLTHIMQRHGSQFAARWGLTSPEQVVRFIRYGSSSTRWRRRHRWRRRRAACSSTSSGRAVWSVCSASSSAATASL
jgi:hypothetical protein